VWVYYEVVDCLVLVGTQYINQKKELFT
jgi:hypothetical protein